MIEKLAFEIKSNNAETICNLLSILKVLGGSNTDEVKVINETCIIETLSNDLEQSKLIHDLVINLSNMIQGGK